MNERIRQLAEQAGLKYHNWITNESNSPRVIRGGCWSNINDGDFKYPRLEDYEKFAQLIVQECANAIVNDSRLSDVRTARNGCVRAIKEHFGVEE
jgi:hypothetical protein